MFSSFTDAVSVPIVLLVLEGGPGTLETVHQAIQNNTPAVIVKVRAVPELTIWGVGRAVLGREDPGP